MPLFRDFADGFWNFDKSEYLKNQINRSFITQSYATQGVYAVKNYLLPTFGNLRLQNITPDMINNWLITFCDKTYTLIRRGQEVELHYKHNTANLVFKILKVMLEWAVYKKILRTNPCKQVKMLNTNDEQKIEILTPDEVRSLFPENWTEIWPDRITYVINKLAAISGMRHGELLGLRGEFVHDTYIDVCGQFNRYGYGDVKTHKSRTIPITAIIRSDLEMLLNENGSGYLFSRNGGKNPISRNTVYKTLYDALAKIGINEAERKRRNLCMHGWRHFFNTTLLMANISDDKVMAITGHSTQKMKRHYSHLDNIKMADVVEVQKNVLSSETSEKTEKKQKEKPKKRTS
jgi:integrase